MKYLIVITIFKCLLNVQDYINPFIHITLFKKYYALLCYYYRDISQVCIEHLKCARQHSKTFHGYCHL